MSAGRYALCDAYVRHDASGRRVSYLALRILPQGATVAGATRTTVLPTEVHRLDLVAYRVLRDSQQAWRIADANDAMDPFSLSACPGRALRLPRSLL